MDTTPEFAVPEPVIRPMDLPQTAPPSKVAAPPASKISVKSLDFFYGSFQALHYVNIEIPGKGITALIGPYQPAPPRGHGLPPAESVSEVHLRQRGVRNPHLWDEG